MLACVNRLEPQHAPSHTQVLSLPTDLKTTELAGCLCVIVCFEL